MHYSIIIWVATALLALVVWTKYDLWRAHRDLFKGTRREGTFKVWNRYDWWLVAWLALIISMWYFNHPRG